jgi:hypothetical protein
MSATLVTPKTTSGGEIVRELVNSSDGQGLNFDGSAGNIDIATPPDLGTAFSFEFVIKADSWPASGSNIYIVDFGNGGRFVLGNPTTGNFSVRSVTGDWISFGSAVLDDLKVHHIVVTVDGTSAIAYDNGNLIGTATINSPNIDSCADARIGSDYVGTASFFNGTIYRARFYNRTLSPDDVRTAYERADVDYSSQYGSQTTINSGTTTKGKRYRITARDGVDFTTVGAADNNIGTEFLATGSVTLDGNDTVVQIGAVSDYDLAFANPTQSLTVQDRAGSADGSCSASGVTQVQPLVQLNSTSARIGTFAAAPADGQILADGQSASAPSYSFGHTTATGMYSPGANQIRFSTASTDRLTISSTGVVNISNLSASSDVQTDGSKNLITSSDKRLKNDIGELTAGLDIISNLQPHYFSWKSDESNTQQLGFYAQDVYEFLPEAAPREEVTNEDGTTDYKWGFNGRPIIAALVAAVKELKAKVETLENS